MRMGIRKKNEEGKEKEILVTIIKIQTFFFKLPNKFFMQLIVSSLRTFMHIMFFEHYIYKSVKISEFFILYHTFDI